MDIGDKRWRKIILEKFDSHCAYCGCDLNMRTLSIDHVRPKERGMDSSIYGESVMDNWFPACKPCNSSKHSNSLELWRHKIFCKVENLKAKSSTFRMALKFGLMEETDNDVVFYFEKYNPYFPTKQQL